MVTVVPVSPPDAHSASGAAAPSRPPEPSVTPPARGHSIAGKLGSLAAKGALWTIAGFGISQVLRLASNMILTRIFPTDVFGLMALITAFLTGLTLFSDVGIRPSIIQSERGDDPVFLNTAWTIQVIRGVILWIVCWALAWPTSVFYEKTLLELLPVAGFATVIMGFNSTKLFTMNRRLNLARLTVIDLGTQIVSLIVTVLLALVTRSVWALVIGGLVSNLVKLVLSHVALPGITNRFHLDRPSARSLFSFGRWIFVSTMLTFVVSQSDRLVFGKLVPLSLLGVYSIGSMIAQMPTQALGQIANQVTFPLYSRTLQSGAPLAAAFRRARHPILLVAGWATAGLAAGGPTIIRILYDQRWAEAGWIVQVLAVGCFFAVVDAVNSAALLALGQVRWNVYGRVAMIAGMAAGIPLGFRFFGFPGAVLGDTVAELIRFAVSAYAIQRASLSTWREDLRVYGVLFASSVLGGLAVGQLGGRVHVAVEAAVVFVVVSACWIPIALPVILEMLRQRKASAENAPASTSLPV